MSPKLRPLQCSCTHVVAIQVLGKSFTLTLCNHVIPIAISLPASLESQWGSQQRSLQGIANAKMTPLVPGVGWKRWVPKSSRFLAWSVSSIGGGGWSQESSCFWGTAADTPCCKHSMSKHCLDFQDGLFQPASLRAKGLPTRLISSHMGEIPPRRSSFTLKEAGWKSLYQRTGKELVGFQFSKQEKENWIQEITNWSAWHQDLGRSWKRQSSNRSANT